MVYLSAHVQAFHDLVGHGANIYLAGRLLYNLSIKHTSCKSSLCLTGKHQVNIRVRVGFSFGFFFTGMG